jgi:hypothetical protein
VDKRRGKLKALVAVARSILVIVWNLLARPGARYQDLGPLPCPTCRHPTTRPQPSRSTGVAWLPGHHRTCRLTLTNQRLTATTCSGSAALRRMLSPARSPLGDLPVRSSHVRDTEEVRS